MKLTPFTNQPATTLARKLLPPNPSVSNPISQVAEKLLQEIQVAVPNQGLESLPAMELHDSVETLDKSCEKLWRAVMSQESASPVFHQLEHQVDSAITQLSKRALKPSDQETLARLKQELKLAKGFQQWLAGFEAASHTVYSALEALHTQVDNIESGAVADFSLQPLSQVVQAFSEVTQLPHVEGESFQEAQDTRLKSLSRQVRIALLDTQELVGSHLEIELNEALAQAKKALEEVDDSEESLGRVHSCHKRLLDAVKGISEGAADLKLAAAMLPPIETPKKGLLQLFENLFFEEAGSGLVPAVQKELETVNDQLESLLSNGEVKSQLTQMKALEKARGKGTGDFIPQPLTPAYRRLIAQQEQRRLQLEKLERWLEDPEAQQGGWRERLLGGFFLLLELGNWVQGWQRLQEEASAIRERVEERELALFSAQVDQEVEQLVSWLGNAQDRRSEDSIKAVLEKLLPRVKKANPQAVPIIEHYIDHPGELKNRSATEIGESYRIARMLTIPQGGETPAIEEIPALPSGTEVPLAEYGNKHRRLVELQELIHDVKMEGVQVPPPFGIANGEVQLYLKENLPAVFTHSKELGNLYALRPEGEEGLQFLQREDVSQLVRLIQEEIREGFAKAPPTEALKKWLSEKTGYLMVRSTGDEDSSYANAGGNLSIAYVNAKAEEVMKAAGQVIASYFSIPSLANRLNARANPFDTPLKLAVTMQELIGEPIGGSKDPAAIPVSIVLFTNEPNLGGDDHFRIMRISASYGHGEAVVGNQGIATDTFYLMQSRTDPSEIYWRGDLKDKPQRLAPIEQGGKVVLGKVDNPDSLRKQPALNEQMLNRLFELGKRVEQRYSGEPTDMEIVVVGDQIFPVQARPVNRPVVKPHYVDPEKIPSGAILQELQGNPQVEGKAEALILRSPDELLVAETLGEAESQFQLGKHRMVINREREPEASHYVVNFSGMGIPALQFEDLSGVRELLEKLAPGQALVVDVQSATVRLWEEQKGKPEESLTQGYLNFPGHVVISLDLDHLPSHLKGKEFPGSIEIKELIRQIKLAKTSQLALEKIEELCSHPALQAIGLQSQNLKEQMKGESLFARVAIKTHDALDNRLKKVCDQALGLQSVPSTNLNRMEVRQYTSEFETLFFKEPAGSLGQAGVIHLEPLKEGALTIMSYLDEVGQKARFADLLVDAQEAPLPETQKRWQELLKGLETADTALQPRIDRFLKVTDLLRSAGALTSWMTLSLTKETDQESITQLLDHLLEGVDESALAAMQNLIDAQSTLLQQRGQLSDFSSPESYPTAFKSLRETVAPFLDSERIQKLNEGLDKSCMPLALLTQSVLNELVDVYDKSIKSMKASTRFSEDDKIAHFKEMVEGYLVIFETWTTQLVDPDSVRRYAQDYLSELRTQFDRAPITSNTLRPSPQFEVPPALITAQTAFERHYPQHLEDVFTLVHQNLLEVVNLAGGRILNQQLLESLNLSPEFNQILGQLSQLGRPQFLGIQIEENRVIAKYNLPIQNHSSTFQIVYDTLSGQTLFRFQFLGEARERWGIINNRLAFLHALEKLTLVDAPLHNDNVLQFTCAVNTQTLGQLLRTTGAAIEYSINQAQETLTRDGLPQNEGLLIPLFSPDSKIWKLSEHKRVDSAIFGIVLRELLGRYENRSEWPLEIQQVIKDWLFEKGHDDVIEADFLSIVGFLVKYEWEDSRIIPMASQIASKSVTASNSRVQPSTLELCKALVEKGRDLKAAEIAANKGVEDPHPRVRNTALELFKTLLEKERGFEAAEIAASKGIEDPNPRVRNTALELLKALFEKERGFEAAEIAANKGIKSPDRDVRNTVLELFKTLVEKGRDCEAAEIAASKGIEDPSWVVQSKALELFKTLVEKGRDFEAAEIAANKGIEAPDPGVRNTALELFKALFEKERGFEAAEKAASKGVEDPTPGVCNTALELFKALVEKGRGFEATEKAASKGIEHPSSYIQYKALELFKALVEKGRGFEAAEKVASKGIEDPSSYFQYEALELFKALFEKGRGFEAAEKGASKGIEDLNPDVRNTALELFKTLVEKGRGFEAAEKGASKGIEHPSSYVQYKAIELFAALFEKGRGFEAAEKVASKGIEDPSSYFQDKALELFKALFEKGRGFEAAEMAASKGIEYPFGDVRNNSQNLFKALFEKGHGFEAAEIAANKGVEARDPRVRIGALELFKALVEKERGLEAASQAAINSCSDRVSYVRHAALKLFQNLIEQEYELEAATQAAIRGVENDNFSILRDLGRFFGSFIFTQNTFEAAVQAAIRDVASPDPSMRDASLELFQKLVEKKYGLEAALEAAKRAPGCDARDQLVMALKSVGVDVSELSS